MPLLDTAGIPNTDVPHEGTPLEVVTRSTAVDDPLTIKGSNIVYGEIEGAHQGAETVDGVSLYSGAAKAYLGPSIGRFVPYGGIGAGVYHESLPGKSDEGTIGLIFAGAKLKFPFGLVVRGEYQWVNMPDGVLVKLDHRYFFAAGLSF